MTLSPRSDGDDRPVVTVILITYNHEAFIEQALMGVLEQRAPFGVELLVTEDCSTDRTLDVISAVRERLDRPFTVLASPLNVCTNVVFTRALDIARGEYIATLDGDDYWTDPTKLARQVEFLRSQPAFAMCFHDVVTIDDSIGAPVGETALGTSELTVCDLLLNNSIPGCSAVIRRSAISNLPPWFADAEFGDWPLYIEAARHGRVGGIGATMGVYRLHGGGLWTGTSTDVRERQRLRFLDRLDPELRRACRRNLSRSRGIILRNIANALLQEGRTADARPFALRSLAAGGLPGYGRSQSVRLIALSTVPRLYRRVAQARRWLWGRA